MMFYGTQRQWLHGAMFRDLAHAEKKYVQFTDVLSNYVLNN